MSENDLELAIITNSYDKVLQFIEDIKPYFETRTLKIEGNLIELQDKLDSHDYEQEKQTSGNLIFKNKKRVYFNIKFNYIKMKDKYKLNYYLKYTIIVVDTNLIFHIIKKIAFFTYLSTYFSSGSSSIKHSRNYICFKNIKIISLEKLFKKYPCKIIAHKQQAKKRFYKLNCFTNAKEREFLEALEKRNIYIEIINDYNNVVYCCFKHITYSDPIKIGENIVIDKEFIFNYITTKILSKITTEEWKYYEKFNLLYNKYLEKIEREKEKEKEKEREKEEKRWREGDVSTYFEYNRGESEAKFSLEIHQIENKYMIYNTVSNFFTNKEKEINEDFEIFYNNKAIQVSFDNDNNKNKIIFIIYDIRNNEVIFENFLSHLKEFVKEASASEYNSRTTPPKILSESQDIPIKIYIKYTTTKNPYKISDLTQKKFKITKYKRNEIKELQKVLEEENFYKCTITYDTSYLHNRVSFNFEYNLSKILEQNNPGKFLYDHIKEIINNSFNEIINIFLLL
ncbi:MAG: hypothetical protein GF317_05790 [Candidatus Lokiarchaeota archaeon]|nr:hypothetical protein [Candidatus Lokiarchaeota archaeon]